MAGFSVARVSIRSAKLIPRSLRTIFPAAQPVPAARSRAILAVPRRSRAVPPGAIRGTRAVRARLPTTDFANSITLGAADEG